MYKRNLTESSVFSITTYQDKHPSTCNILEYKKAMQYEHLIVLITLRDGGHYGTCFP